MKKEGEREGEKRGREVEGEGRRDTCPHVEEEGRDKEE